MAALTIREAAARLKLSQRQLSYAISRGAPTVERGRKGRRHATLVDPEAMRRWFDARDPSNAQHRKLAADLIRDVAESIALQFRTQSGPHKPALLVNLLGSFYSTAAAIHRQLGLPPLQAADVPLVIKQMDKTSVHLTPFANLDGAKSGANCE